MSLPQSESPFFVVGPPRSGTSLLTEALDAHPRFAVVPETWVFRLLIRLGSSERFPSRRHASLLPNQVWRCLSWSDPLAARVVAEVAIRAAREPPGPRGCRRRDRPGVRATSRDRDPGREEPDPRAPRERDLGAPA